MKKTLILLLLTVLCVTGCAKNNDADITGGSNDQASVYVEPEIEKIPESEKTKETVKEDTSDKNITEDQALLAIKNYCYESNPDLKDMEKSDDYTIYWEVVSSDKSQIVVLFRSYTGALVRYYIDPVSGDTYVTEFVAGITDEEERTEESFNVRDYLNEGKAKDSSISIEGTWQTASMGYESDGDIQPEYYVQFTDKEINYGHMKGSEFVLDHADKISLIEETSNGYRVKAEGQNNVKYTYQTSESDKDVLEYFETWDENEFPDMYRGGASLSKQLN